MLSRSNPRKPQREEHRLERWCRRCILYKTIFLKSARISCLWDGSEVCALRFVNSRANNHCVAKIQGNDKGDTEFKTWSNSIELGFYQHIIRVSGIRNSVSEGGGIGGGGEALRRIAEEVPAPRSRYP